MRRGVFFALILLITAGIGYVFTMPGGSEESDSLEKRTPVFEWRVPEDEHKYENLEWHKINTGRLDGFTVSETGVFSLEEFSGSCGRGINDSCTNNLVQIGILEETTNPIGYEYLRREGGWAKTYYYLVLVRNGRGELINSKQKLQKTFAPVDSENEAMSFIATTMPDLKFESIVSTSSYAGISTLYGYTATAVDGYLVKAVANDSWFCSSHIPFWVVFKVAKSGDVTVVATEDVSELSGPNKGTCFD